MKALRILVMALAMTLALSSAAMAAPNKVTISGPTTATVGDVVSYDVSPKELKGGDKYVLNGNAVWLYAECWQTVPDGLYAGEQLVMRQWRASWQDYAIQWGPTKSWFDGITADCTLQAMHSNNQGKWRAVSGKVNVTVTP